LLICLIEQDILFSARWFSLTGVVACSRVSTSPIMLGLLALAVVRSARGCRSAFEPFCEAWVVFASGRYSGAAPTQRLPGHPGRGVRPLNSAALYTDTNASRAREVE
jgi:hypothetical protein